MKSAQTMQAATLDVAGAAFRIAPVPRPAPQPGQVLVRIAASAVNPLDLKMRAGQAAHARQPLPAILGIDLAGTVEAVGDGVTDFRPGDEVYGMTGGVGGLQGSLAQFASVDADLLARKPGNIGMREAASLPLIFITAWEGLVDRAGVHAGQKVLVHGGAGGVGHIAVQIARAFGADVFATGSAASQAYIKGLGATGIDYRAMSVENYVAKYSDGRGFDIVYDTVGGATLDASFNAVIRFGHVVSALGWGTHALAPLSFRAASLFGRVHAAADADGRRPRASRRDFARGDAARGGRQDRPPRRSQAFCTVERRRCLSRRRGQRRYRQDRGRHRLNHQGNRASVLTQSEPIAP